MHGYCTDLRGGRFMLGNLNGHRSADNVSVEQLHEIDRYMLCRCNDLLGWCCRAVWAG